MANEARITQQYVEVAGKLNPSATTIGADNSGSEAVLSGRVNHGDALIDSVGAYFQHRESGGSWSSTTEQTGITGNFHAKITGLVAGTTYEYRAVVSRSGELFYGATKSFVADQVYSDGFSSGILTDTVVSGGLVLGPDYVAGDEDRYSTNTLSGGSFTSINQRIDAKKTTTIYAVTMRSRGTDEHTVSFRTSADVELASGSGSGVASGSWHTFVLSAPVQITNGTRYHVYFTKPSSTIYTTTSLHDGTLWKAINFTLSNGTTYNQTLAMGLVEADEVYNASGTRTKPHALSGTFPGATISWTATTPASTSLTVHAQVQGQTAITDEAVGTGDGAETAFVLDHWPVGTVTVKVDGAAETGFTQDVNDPRKITFTTAPADTLAVTASYTGVDAAVTLDWAAQTSATTLTVPTASTDVTNKHLWLKQTLATTDSEVTPMLTVLEVELSAVNDVTGLLDGKLRIRSAATLLMDGKALVVASTDADNQLDGKAIVRGSATNLLDGLGVVKSTALKLLDGKATVQSAGTDTLDGLALIKSSAVGLLDGAARIKSAGANLLDGRAAVISGADATALLDGLLSIGSAATLTLDGKVVVGDQATNLMDGWLSVANVGTGLLDGRAVIQSAGAETVDGLVVIRSAGSNLLDGALTVADSATGLLDGALIIKETATVALDGKATIKDVAQEILDGRVIVRSGIDVKLDGLLKVKMVAVGMLDGTLVVLSDGEALLDGTVFVSDGDWTMTVDGQLIITRLAQRIASVTFAAREVSAAFEPKQLTAAFVVKKPTITITIQ